MITVTDYRNAQHNMDSTIDLEILTDQYGWIPTTIDPNDGDEESHIVQIKEWLVDNAGSIADYVAPVVPPKTASEKIAEYTDNIQKLLDDTAMSKGYDSINAIGKYIGYVNPFQTECEALGLWTANVWATAYTIMGAWQGGGTEPTYDEILAQLPAAP